MKILIVLNTFRAIFVIVQGDNVGERILGGNEAQPGQFKYIASISLDKPKNLICGASIIGPRALITAAHCNEVELTRILVYMGVTKLDDENGTSYEVESFVSHEDYENTTFTSDIAVIILKKDIIFGEFIQPIALASHPIADNERLTHAGWGWTTNTRGRPKVLQWLEMNVVPEDICKETAPRNITTKICTLEAMGKGACFGDSGGPLVNKLNEIVGIASTLAYVCGLGDPDYFTDVYYFKDWVIEKAKL